MLLDRRTLHPFVSALVFVLLTACWLSPAYGADPVLSLEVQVLPAGPIIARQRVDLVLELATDSYFLGGTKVAELDLPDVVAPLGQRHSSNFSRTVAGDTQAVQRWVQPLYAQRAGVLRLPALAVQVVLPGADGAAEVFDLMAPAIQLQVLAPTGLDPVATAGDWFASPDFLVTDSWQPDPVDLAVGDVLRREIRQQADDVPAMMLPAPVFAEVPGTALYRQPPELSDQGSRGRYQGQRIDRVDYVLEQPGKLQLPELQFHWWDTDAGVMRQEVLPALDLLVLGDADVLTYAPEAEVPRPWRVVQPGWQQLPAMLTALASGVLVALLVLGWSSRLGQPQHPATLWRQFRAACQRGDAVAAAALLYRWHDGTRGPGDAALLWPADETGLTPEAAAGLAALLAAAYGRPAAAGPDETARLGRLPGKLAPWRRQRSRRWRWPFRSTLA